MAMIYQFQGSTLYLCEDCLNSHGPVPGKWIEDPLAECSVCGEIDLQSREEMDQWHHDMSNQQWEEDQQEPDYDPQELK